MNRRIKILEIIDEDKIGGGQVHLYLLSKYLDKSKFDIYVACEGKGFLSEKLRSINVKVIPISISNKLKINSLKSLIKIYNEHNFDIIHTHGGTAGFWGRVTVLFVKRKPYLVHTFHGIHYLNFELMKRIPYILVDRLLTKLTDVTVYVCKSDYEKGIANKLSIEKKSMIIYNGIEVDKFETENDRKVLKQKFNLENYFVYCNIGRLHEQKGQKYLIQAFAKVHKIYNNTKLLIVGGGDLFNELKKIAEDLCVSMDVIFMGAREDVDKILKASDVFVLSSLWEGQPLAILEAMAAKIPIVSTLVDGVSEVLVNEDNALLCNPSDLNSLAEAMIRCYNDPELCRRLTLSANKVVKEKFAAQNNADRIGNLYETLFEK